MLKKPYTPKTTIMDNQISKNFKLSEFLKNYSGTPTTAQIINIAHLALIMQRIRDALSEPITITSGLRSAEHNKQVGGSPSSHHLSGSACDFTVRNISPRDAGFVIATILNVGFLPPCELIIYKTHLHIAFQDKTEIMFNKK